MRELWIAGFPSYYGGADTELDHLIDLWRWAGIDVHLVPMFGCDPGMMNCVLARGCHIHPYSHAIFRGKTVVNFCNSQFLDRLPNILNGGRPKKVIWVNCMTWTFPQEKIAHQNGWIDAFGYQTRFQEGLVRGELEQIAPVNAFRFRPFFNCDRVPAPEREIDGASAYAIGRISRDDPWKFPPEMWQTFADIRVPAGRRKKILVLGYGENARKKLGPPPLSLDCWALPPQAMPQADFYARLHTLVYKTGGFVENSPRVLFESWAYGVVPVVECAYGFPELVIHGINGFMAQSSEEMIHYASRLAFEREEWRRMSREGRQWLEREFGDPEKCIGPWDGLIE